MKFILRTLISAGVIALLAFVLSGIHINGGFLYIILIALVLSLLNTFVRPLLVFFTLPATIVSMGLFLLVINAGIIMIADYFMEGLVVDSFWWALLFSILMSIITSVVNNLIKPKPKAIDYNSDKGKVIIIDNK
ncbi:MAG: phage holin family protein [Chitinophagales bacterium]|nr:phage holin family protein [Chitinophagales bacterium]